MKGNPETKRQFQRGAYNAAVAFNSTRRAQATIASFPEQLKKLEKQLQDEENSKYPDAARIKRIKDAIVVQQELIARYCTSAKE